jgi:DNA-binding transcriptional LysR family regulator
MDYLSWDLAILSRAVAFPNLSGASAHVGLSQPQLSRIVQKLEAQLGVTLLDREARRKASWTPAAYRLAEIYQQTYHAFRNAVSGLAAGLSPEHLRVGTLEGLLDRAMTFCQAVLKETKVMVVELSVLDTSFLEEQFSKNDLDIIFSVREPGRKKWRYVKALGWQSVDAVDKGPLRIFSAFEYASVAHKGTATEKAFVSNSLEVRQRWIERFGAL